VRRVNVKGTSGAGKTTIAAVLAERLGVPHIELDALHHGPNWTEASAEEFQRRVKQAMDASPDGWVIDGNYERKLGTLVTDAADTLLWIDLPLPVILLRLWQRTSHRIRHNVELWNGNREAWKTALWGRESLFVWAVRSHRRHRREWPARFAAHPGLVRLRSSAEVRGWLAEHT
jgi:adenylate kinase family enzyme